MLVVTVSQSYLLNAVSELRLSVQCQRHQGLPNAVHPFCAMVLLCFAIYEITQLCAPCSCSTLTCCMCALARLWPPPLLWNVQPVNHLAPLLSAVPHWPHHSRHHVSDVSAVFAKATAPIIYLMLIDLAKSIENNRCFCEGKRLQ